MTQYSSQPLSPLRGEVAPKPEAASTGPVLQRLWQVHQQLRRASGPGVAERALELRRVCQQVCELHAIDVELHGSLPARPAVIVANHLGYIDPVVLCSLIPCSPVAKSEIQSWPLVGEPLLRLNVSFVRRGSAQSGARVLKQCLRTLRSGVSVLNFPEGTTSRGALLPFQLGAFWLARRSGLPIIPIAMDFETPDMCWVDAEAFLPHYGRVLWGKMRGRRRRVRVCIGEPIEPARFQSEIAASFAARSAIARLRRPFSDLELQRG